MDTKTKNIVWVVSIQLMSPASGNKNKKHRSKKMSCCFHSINVPSEWEHYEVPLLTYRIVTGKQIGRAHV